MKKQNGDIFYILGAIVMVFAFAFDICGKDSRTVILLLWAAIALHQLEVLTRK